MKLESTPSRIALGFAAASLAALGIAFVASNAPDDVPVACQLSPSPLVERVERVPVVEHGPPAPGPTVVPQPTPTVSL